MPGEDLKIRAIVEAILKDKGFRDAVQSLGGIERSGRAAERSLSVMDSTVSRLGTRLVQFLGVAAITRLVRTSIVAFSQYERGLRALRDEYRRVGLDSDLALDRTRGFLAELESGTGALRRDTLPVFQRLFGILGSVEGAMEATRQAAFLSERGFGDVASTAQGLIAILQGRAVEAASSFGIAIKKVNGETKTAAELMQEIIAGNEGWTASTRDTDDALDDFRAGLNDMKLLLGEISSGIATLGGPLFADLAKSLRAGAEFWREFAAAGRAVFEEAGGGKAGLHALNLERIGAEFRKRHMAQRKAEAERGVVDRNEVELKGQTALLEQAARKDAEARAESAEKKRKQLAEEAEKRKEFEASTVDELVDIQVKREEEGGIRRLAMEQIRLERLRQRAVEEAKRLGADVEAVERTFHEARLLLLQEFDERRLEDEEKAADQLREARRRIEEETIDIQLGELEKGDERRRELLLRRLELERDAEIQHAEETGLRIEEIEVKFAARRGAIERQLDEDKKELDEERLTRERGLAQATLGLLSTLFGENKALAIAQAIINTYEGATKALAQGGFFGQAMAAIIIATGLAQVRKIQQTEPGEGLGFDDPENDRLARVMTRRWAGDFVRQVGLGIQDFTRGVGAFSPPAPAAAAVGATTVHNWRIGVLVGGEPGLRDLKRRLERIDRSERPRRIG